jgi:carbohydrate-selective porin OprB
VKLAPRTPKAGYSKLTFWHTDGTKNGEPANASLGPSGWGFFLKLEQELTADGRLIGIVRYGRSYDDSAAYKQLASAHLLFYDPHFIGHIRNDLVGIAFNWAEVPVSAARSEYNVEAFYRFPIFPSVDMTLSYQSVINPALDRDNDHASVFSLRLRTTF